MAVRRADGRARLHRLQRAVLRRRPSHQRAQSVDHPGRHSRLRADRRAVRSSASGSGLQASARSPPWSASRRSPRKANGRDWLALAFNDGDAHDGDRLRSLRRLHARPAQSPARSRASAFSPAWRWRPSSPRCRCWCWEVASGGFIWPTWQGACAAAGLRGAGPAFVSQIFYMRGVELIGPGRAGVFVNLVPAFGAVMAVVLLGEAFAAYHVVALVLVVGGIAIAQRGRRRGRARDRPSSVRPWRRSPDSPARTEMGSLDRTESRSDGVEFGAWRADPKGEPRGGVVVVQEIFGVNAHIRAVAERYAAEGYLAIAPAMFDRAEHDVDSPTTPKASRAAWRSPASSIANRCCATSPRRSKSPGARGKVGGRRLLLGGTLAWLAAAHASPTSRRGRLLRRRNRRSQGLKPRVPTMLHFGEQDAHIPRRRRARGRGGPSRRARLPLSRRATASIATAGRPTTRRARRSPGAHARRSSPSNSGSGGNAATLRWPPNGVLSPT